jgi:hypothetical protein
MPAITAEPFITRRQPTTVPPLMAVRRLAKVSP